MFLNNLKNGSTDDNFPVHVTRKWTQGKDIYSPSSKLVGRETTDGSVEHGPWANNVKIIKHIKTHIFLKTHFFSKNKLLKKKTFLEKLTFFEKQTFFEKSYFLKSIV